MHCVLKLKEILMTRFHFAFVYPTDFYGVQICGNTCKRCNNKL